jgi:hypothetical protein
MAGTLKIGGNVIATHAGSEGAGTVTLDSSTLTIGSNTTIQGTMNAGTIGTGVTINAGSNVSGIGQLVGTSIAPNTGAGTDGNDVTIDPDKDYIIHFLSFNSSTGAIYFEVWRAVGNGTGHAFTDLTGNQTSSMGVGSNSDGTCYVVVDSPLAYASGLVFEEGSTFDMS